MRSLKGDPFLLFTKRRRSCVEGRLLALHRPYGHFGFAVAAGCVSRPVIKSKRKAPAAVMITVHIRAFESLNLAMRGEPGIIKPHAAKPTIAAPSSVSG